jgi:hypothetical protein
VEYGLTTELGSATGAQPNLVTNHQVRLSGLTPNTGYYYRVASSTPTEAHTSPTFFMVTTNYVTTNEVFGITNAWTFTNITANFSGTEWTEPAFDDSTWGGPGEALLWADVGVFQDIAPKGVELPGDPADGGRPYLTYYFRTHFILNNVAPGGLLNFAGYIDDGAVIYLNGTEIQRVRMPPTSDASTLATTYPCDGDATPDCLDTFVVSMDSLTNLVVGDNVVAAEVHKYNLLSPDVTFGLALRVVEPILRTVRLDIARAGSIVSLTWDDPAFILQSSDSPDGVWEDVGGTPESPFQVEAADSERFYRLQK